MNDQPLIPVGDIWRMTDAFGTRIAIIAGFGLGEEQSVYCLDVDVCAEPEILGAGEFAALEDAVQAWRFTVGDTAADSRADVVSDPQWLTGVLEYAATDLDNDADRDVSDRAQALTRRWRDEGVQPKSDEPLSLSDTSQIVDVFIRWHRERFKTAVDVSAAVALAWHWHTVAIRGTWGRISPHRAAHLRAVIHGWDHNEMVRAAALKLLPRWVLFLGECGKLPPSLVQSAVDAAAKDACASCAHQCCDDTEVTPTPSPALPESPSESPATQRPDAE
ncbi:hypothetical protein [Nocardia yamanashiensis]|uniref:hypothetical protein n=1 Tax=Nocardia yamanashiensis TaxID=209247 RepID=UPI000833A526|nr:hypothetical protein [Nocardia yamanashiensis]